MEDFLMTKMRFFVWWTVLVSMLSTALALPVQDVSSSQRNISELNRLVIYFQTTHDAKGNPISMLPLIHEQGIALTHLIVCSFHINQGSVIHLNDYPPDSPHFYTLWNETAIMKEAGVQVMGMIGGAASGSFTNMTLDATDEEDFEYYYGQMHDVIKKFGLQGMDLDVEQDMSQSGITRLVKRLYADFGDNFTITLAPVASALENGSNLSGFDYETLQLAAVTCKGVKMIDFLNAQFYSGFASMDNPADFESIVAHGWDSRMIVAGQLTDPRNGGGFTSISTLNQTVIELVKIYGEIGGIMGWEYFDSDPGGTAAPWKWAQEMTEILRPNDRLKLTITDETACRLTVAWQESVVKSSAGKSSTSESQLPETNVNYFGMVTA